MTTNTAARTEGDARGWRLTAILGVALLALAGPALAQAAEPPIQLAERTLDLDQTATAPQTEIIEIEGVDNRFGSLLLETLNGRFAVQIVRVTVDEGGTRGIVRTLAVDKILTPREAVAEVTFSETEARLRRIEVEYRRADSGASGKALLRVSARRGQAGAVPSIGPSAKVEAPSEPRLESPQPAGAKPAAETGAGAARAASLVQLASRKFDLARPEITIRLASEPEVTALQLKLRDLPLIVRKAVAKLASGESRDLQVAELIEAGGASRIVEIAVGEPVRISEITLTIRQRAGAGQGTLEVWGDGRPRAPLAEAPAARAERSPPPPARVPREPVPSSRGPEPGWREAELGPRPPLPSDLQRLETGWKLLGAAREAGRDGRRLVRRATFAIRDEGDIGAVRFLARRDVIRLIDARVVFDDGARQPLGVGGYDLEPGQMTEVLRMRTRGRSVVRVEVVYRPLETYVGAPVLELWAEVGAARAGRSDDDRDRVRVIPPADGDEPDEE